MRLLFGSLLLLATTATTGKAQQSVPLNENAYSDSLGHVLQHAVNDSTRARVNFQLSEYWRGKDTAKSAAFLETGRALSSSSPYVKALYPFYLGQLYFASNTAKAADAFLQAQQALAAFTTREAYLYQSMSWFNYGIMLRNEKGDDFVVNTWLNKAIPLAEKAGNDEKIAHFYTQLATLLMNNARFDKAETYNNKAITLLETKHPSSSSLLFAYLSAASNNIYNKKPSEARVCLDKAWKLLAPYPQSVNLPNYYYNEALYYTTVNEFDSAMTSLNKGIAMAKQLNQQQLLQMLVFRKYNILLESKQYGPARALLMELMQEGTLTKEVNNRKMIYQHLAAVNASLGDMREAYNWSQQYSKLSDSLSESKLQKNIQELEIKYNKAEDEKKIAALDAAKTKATLSAHNQRLMNWLLGIASLLLLAIASFAMLLYRNNKKLAKQKELNYLQQLRDAEQQKQIQIGQALLQGEENERERIARDLHDGLGGMLAGIKLNLSTLPGSPATSHNELHKIISQIDHSSTELRRIAHNMMPEALLSYGLAAALYDLCDSLSSDQLSISFQPFGLSTQLPKGIQVTIYRIVQEMLSNAMKHAHATHIVIQCSQNQNILLITAEDNGKGFDMSLIGRTKGIGLTNIKKRVEYLQGKMEIIAAINEGTTINIELNVAG
ncbi:Signal transduction histidine kinase [Filimonas lacunae]|uniref:histidine kinase n=1 Tax=Filimonas lacunae TaxID=477680 RepID=A0A173MCL0_9BACT|nr:sensor histidine kinase [Filimonas lacunae]BAV05314.1 sensory box histidine kinase [Filimonas lacunae]SIT22033.1 Signal transduction histidine kinase [Filimonas lacunae]